MKKGLIVGLLVAAVSFGAGTYFGRGSKQDLTISSSTHGASYSGGFKADDATATSGAAIRSVAGPAPTNVVVVKDGESIQAAIKAARDAIEAVLRHDGIDARICLSHWDDELDDWHQTDPPPTAQQRQAEDDERRDAETIETRTLIASVGKEIRAEFEQSMLNSADELGVECKILEHPHLLTTQVGFTVTGAKRKVEEFAQGLTAEERATFRTDTTVMLSPL